MIQTRTTRRNGVKVYENTKALMERAQRKLFRNWAFFCECSQLRLS